MTSHKGVVTSLNNLINESVKLVQKLLTEKKLVLEPLGSSDGSENLALDIEPSTELDIDYRVLKYIIVQASEKLLDLNAVSGADHVLNIGSYDEDEDSVKPLIEDTFTLNSKRRTLTHKFKVVTLRKNYTAAIISKLLDIHETSMKAYSKTLPPLLKQARTARSITYTFEFDSENNELKNPVVKHRHTYTITQGKTQYQFPAFNFMSHTNLARLVNPSGNNDFLYAIRYAKTRILNQMTLMAVRLMAKSPLWVDFKKKMLALCSKIVMDPIQYAECTVKTSGLVAKAPYKSLEGIHLQSLIRKFTDEYVMTILEDPTTIPTITSKNVPACVSSKYTLGSMLGAGAYGTVYKGVHTKTGATVAIKFMYGNNHVPSVMDEVAMSKKLHSLGLGPKVYSFFKCKVDSVDYLVIIKGLVNGVEFNKWFDSANRTSEQVNNVNKKIKQVDVILKKNQIYATDIHGANFMIDTEGNIQIIDAGFIIDDDVLSKYEKYFDTREKIDAFYERHNRYKRLTLIRRLTCLFVSVIYDTKL